MKTVYNISIKLMAAGLIIWVVETVAFLFIEGWHYTATNKTEVLLDQISGTIIKIGFLLWLFVAAKILHIILQSLPPSNKSNQGNKKPL